jgi:hypothetical protein
MTTPEKDKPEKSGDFAEKWYEKWLELFGHLLGVKDLEKTVTGLASENDQNKVKDALLKLQGGDKEQERTGFLHKLTNLLLHREENGKQGEIEKLLHDTLETGTDNKSKVVKDRFVKALNDPKEDGVEFDEARKETNQRKREALDKEQLELTRVGLDQDKELELLRNEIGQQVTEAPKVLSDEDRDKKIEDFWVKTEEELIVEETTQKLKKPSLVDSTRRVEMQAARELYEKIASSPDQFQLNERQIQILDNFLYKHLMSGDEGADLMMDVLFKKLGTEQFGGLISAMRRESDGERGVSRGGNEQVAGMDRLVDLLTGRRQKGKRSVDQFDENDWNELRISGLLNINPERYAEYNELIEKEFGIKKALVVDKENKSAKLNDVLGKLDRDKINAYFRGKLVSKVRMMVDESVRIDQSNADARATEYATIMSIMGLSTSMKSDVMNSARRMTFAFMVFNTPQTPDGYKQLCEYAAQIGSEYSVFKNVMMMREKIEVKLEGGKEVELTDLSQIDFVNVASQAILDKEDRLHYGITKGVDEVGRTYADMMMASNLREQKLEDWIPVTRKVLKERLGEDGYIAMLKRIGVINDAGMRDTKLEHDYLKATGDKYWDYYNGIYTYYSMTRSSGEFVGNANPDNGELKLPAGLNENFAFKMDPSAWATFLYAYNVPNFPEMIELYRRNGNSSLASKEGNELLSYLIQVKKDPVGKLPTIADAFYSNGKEPDKKDLIKLSKVFVGSIFLPDQYHLGEKSEDALKHSHIYDTIPLKYDKDGNLKLDATAKRRDFANARKEMARGLAELYRSDPSLFNNMDFAFLRDRFSHDQVLVDALADPNTSNLQKMIAFADRWGEDKGIFENLSNKRPDDFTKYAIDYHGEWQGAATKLAEKPTWAMYIKMMSVVERIVGKGEKIDPLTMRGFELMVELRKAMVYGQQYTVMNQEGGRLHYDHGNYSGELPGHNPVPDVKVKKVTFRDIQENGGKSPSRVSIAGGKGEVDEEGDEQKMLGQLKMASLLTEDTYKHERKHLAKELLWWKWHSDRPFLTEAWDTVTGKKIINYLAIEVFDMPPEYFLEMVIGGTGDFVKMWWKYLNGSGAGGH